jgi:hypothetical protein
MIPMTRTQLVAGLAGVALMAAAGDALAQTPYDFVSQLDFECRRAEGPPPVQDLRIRQLNPVLQGHLPNQRTELGALNEICVPVAKNFQTPSQPALSFIEWIDLACYAASAEPVDVDVKLSHLNPVLAGLPEESVTLTELSQVCVPVSKNNVPPPEPVRDLANHFDLACYDLAEPTAFLNFPLWLSHLNPVIRAMGLPNRFGYLQRARQLCVPIAKEEQPVPPGPLSRVQWSDFLKYKFRPVAPIPPLPLWIRHLNPLFAWVAPFWTELQAVNPALPAQWPELMVPVAKNGQLPPGAPD